MKPTVQELLGTVFKTFFQVVKVNLCFIITTAVTSSRHTLRWGGSENDEREETRLENGQAGRFTNLQSREFRD